MWEVSFYSSKPTPSARLNSGVRPRAMQSTPSSILEEGRTILAPFLEPFGFSWRTGASGSGSGGPFASGSYVRGDRRLEVHFRYSLGLVTYHLRDESISHQDFVRIAASRTVRSQYPGFSDDPLDGFRHLAHDLDVICSSFVEDSETGFQEVLVLSKSASSRPRLP